MTAPEELGTIISPHGIAEIAEIAGSPKSRSGCGQPPRTIQMLRSPPSGIGRTTSRNGSFSRNDIALRGGIPAIAVLARFCLDDAPLVDSNHDQQECWTVVRLLVRMIGWKAKNRA
ncbi:hypothetical protein [Tuwongella immobilis]|uniref:hypothetical protein n=1 Tax=Tuwongella immobilis TaxID=692036 RepID=UPI0013A6AA40|nr:hypothetical protein [Tuwongella immobilis]